MKARARNRLLRRTSSGAQHSEPKRCAQNCSKQAQRKAISTSYRHQNIEHEADLNGGNAEVEQVLGNLRLFLESASPEAEENLNREQELKIKNSFAKHAVRNCTHEEQTQRYAHAHLAFSGQKAFSQVASVDF